MARADFSDPNLLALFLAGRQARAVLDGKKRAMANLARKADVPPRQIERAMDGQRIKQADRRALWQAMGFDVMGDAQ